MAIAAAGSVQAQDDVKIGFITKFPVPFFTSMEDAAKAYAAANPGVEIVFGQGASATDIEGQIALIESMVTNGVQGIALTPVDPTVATALDKAIESGVKVVLMDNNIPDWEGRTALATTDNYAAGKIAGGYLKTVLKDGDTLGILEGVPGVPSLDDRVNGMMEGLEGVAVEIVGRGATNCTEELGISVAEDLLTANPELKAIYSACGPPAAGAARAITNAGIAPDDIVLVGFDFCCGEAEALTAGTEDATVAQFPTKMAELGVDALVRSIRGEEVELADRLRRRSRDQGQHGRISVGQGGPAVASAPPTQFSETLARGTGTVGITMQLVNTLVCSQPGHLRLERRPAPRPAEGEALVRPLRVGICGTDYHIFAGKHPFLEYPRVMGHELAAEIVETPDNSLLQPGEVCVVNPYLACGQCVACWNGKPNCCVHISVLGVHQDGGMAELLSVPAFNLMPAPDLSPDRARRSSFSPSGPMRSAGAPCRPGIGFSSSGPARSASGLRSSPDIRGRPSSPSTGPPTVRRARALSPAWTPSRSTRARWTPGFPTAPASTPCSTRQVAGRPWKKASTTSRTADVSSWSAWSRSQLPSWTLTSTGKKCHSTEAATPHPRTLNALSPRPP